MSAPYSELVSFPAGLFAGLPVETRLHLRLRDFTDEIIFASGERHASDPVAGLLLDGAEVAALAAGVDADRAWSSDLLAWLERKRADRAYRISEPDVLAGAVRNDRGAATLGEVLARFDLELVGVEVAEQPSAAQGVRQAA